MSILGIGTDIVNVQRFDLNKRHFIEKILTVKELQVFDSFNNEQAKREYLGGRFAGKEAYLKANHLGLWGLSFLDIEILNKESGEPFLNDTRAQISLSHDGDYAVAFVIIEDK